MSDCTKIYLDALGGPDDAAGPVLNNLSLAGVEHTVYDAEYALEHQYLDDDLVGPYLAGLRWAPPSRGLSAKAVGVTQAINGSARQKPLSVSFAKLDRRWTAEKYPLMLCEFLAYKSGLAYRSPREIRRDLLGIGSDGRRYSEDIGHYAFFDSTHPTAMVHHGDTQAFAFVHHRTGYVIFRGTSSLSDVRTDFRYKLTTKTYANLPEKEQTLVGKPAPARHTGFAVAWGSVAPDVEAWAAEQHRQGRIDGIVFSGHSLGGALAILAAHQFAAKRLCPVNAVVTFGAPKVGGPEFKNSYNNLGLHDRTLRVESADDVIAGMSGSADINEHVGHPWQFKQRPLRPAWQMFLFSSLIDPIEMTKKKIERIERKKARRNKPESSARRVGSNSAPAHGTWRDYLLKLALKTVWYMTRWAIRMASAHSVEHRYGLFISTLAYRKIRAHRLNEAKLRLLSHRGQEVPRIIIESAYRTACEDLKHHLGVVRGRHPRTFRHLAQRPIRVESPEEFDKVASKYVHYIG